MATIDLGKISFVWKGTYSGGTALKKMLSITMVILIFVY